MRTTNKSKNIMEATMQIVAEQGLTALSTRLAARRAGVSDGLMYRFFESKDELLYACFESVHREIAGLFDGMTEELAAKGLMNEKADPSQLMHVIWEKYFRFLIQNGYKTLFYFEYRNSSYIKQIQERDEDARATYFEGFVSIMNLAEEMFHFEGKISEAVLWSYILDTSGMFAGRIIRGELPDTEETITQVWQLMGSGLNGLFTEN